jgi:hypothetical protein
LRGFFARWGRPRRLRVDNGVPWGSWSDLPPALALWLIGLDIEVLWNPPRQPQKNGVVERSQGTAKRWAEPRRCASAAELQQRLDEADRLQREDYPYADGRSRWAVFPALAHSGRPYSRAWERRSWSLGAVRQHLADYAVRRRVDKSGHVSVYDRNYYVGALHRGQAVFVMFDPQRSEWLFSDERGAQLRSHPAHAIEAGRIIKLQLVDEGHGSAPSAGAAKPLVSGLTAKPSVG